MDRDDDLDNIRGEPRFQQIRSLAAELDVPGYPSQAKDRDSRVRREWEAALPRIAAATVRHPKVGLAWYNRGYAHLALGEPEQAVRPFEKAAELGYRPSTSMYNAACAHALAGHTDEAFAWLDRAVSAGFDSWWTLLNDEDIDALRGDPRFRTFLDLARRHEHDWN
jgi:tetratricopeptide (TPR) repeat protein